MVMAPYGKRLVQGHGLENEGVKVTIKIRGRKESWPKHSSWKCLL
jgi:hypothetical protein